MLPSHSGRSFNTQGNLVFKSSNNFFHYYDYTFLPENETHMMKLGILPNHLIQLLRLNKPENLARFTDDLRFTTFWSTYSIWAKHQALSRAYWKSYPNAVKLMSRKKSRKKSLKPQSENENEK